MAPVNKQQKKYNVYAQIKLDLIKPVVAENLMNAVTVAGTLTVKDFIDFDSIMKHGIDINDYELVSIDGVHHA